LFERNSGCEYWVNLGQVRRKWRDLTKPAVNLRGSYNATNVLIIKYLSFSQGHHSYRLDACFSAITTWLTYRNSKYDIQYHRHTFVRTRELQINAVLG